MKRGGDWKVNLELMFTILRYSSPIAIYRRGFVDVHGDPRKGTRGKLSLLAEILVAITSMRVRVSSSLTGDSKSTTVKLIDIHKYGLRSVEGRRVFHVRQDTKALFKVIYVT